jgi:hypothetical protein
MLHRLAESYGLTAQESQAAQKVQAPLLPAMKPNSMAGKQTLPLEVAHRMMPEFSEHALPSTVTVAAPVDTLPKPMLHGGDTDEMREIETCMRVRGKNDYVVDKEVEKKPEVKVPMLR